MLLRGLSTKQESETAPQAADMIEDESDAFLDLALLFGR